jgi:predicted secreted protein with PEFG-CTERM motif
MIKNRLHSTSLAAVSFLLLFSLSSLANESFASSDVTGTQSIEMTVDDSTYTATYVMSNGGSIDSISADVSNLVVVMELTSPSNGTLDITFPRELYDVLTFTEHSGYGPIVMTDEEDVTEDVEVNQACEQTSVGIPVRANTERVELSYGDILGNHSHTYPGKIELLKSVKEQGQEFSVGIVTDAKKCDMTFTLEEKNLHFDIRGREEVEGGEGYFRLMLPHDLLGGNYTVLVDGQSVNFTEQTYFFPSYDKIGVQSAERTERTPLAASDIVFSYPKDATSVVIIGTTAMPEFGIVVSLVMAIAIVGIIVASKQIRIKT